MSPKLKLEVRPTMLQQSDLRPACDRCFGLCCVALPFAKSAQFALDKDGGTPCPHLQRDFRCGIHACLRERGYAGCTAFDCFGAGQKVSQTTFAGQDWRSDPTLAARMFEVFPIVRQLHELLWYLREALTREAARELHAEVQTQLEQTEQLTHQHADALLGLDVPAHRQKVAALLLRVSERVRRDGPKKRRDKRGADLIGKDLRGVDLRAASLRGAYLIAADLRQVDLRLADMIGADLRDADVRGADLTDCLFLTQAQLEAARGDVETKIPQCLTRPAHWSLAGV